MSVDLNWEALTTGSDGIALAEEIRNFVHTKFQTVTLPRFIKGVNVHAFEFGSIAPEVELKDICDPLPDFYEKTEDDYDEDEETDEEDEDWQDPLTNDEARSPKGGRRIDRAEKTYGQSHVTHPPSYIDTRLTGRSMQSLGDLGSPFLGVNSTGIPGGTSNLHYFHSQLAAGLSGAQTPLAAVAGAHLPNGWPDYSNLPSESTRGHHHSASGGSLSPPQTADSANQQSILENTSISSLTTSSPATRPQTRDGDDAIEDEPISPPRRFRKPRVEDVQTVFRVRYSGDVKLSLTAEILLDYPMPSFVGIPVKLKITGLSFDGVAVLAYIRKRAHFCFLSPEDAYTAIGAEEGNELTQGHGMKMGGLLHEIKVESEIGQRENGKQVLKNVGKVEKFVLEQVRRIFEDEFVYPSFWTFLV